MLVLRRVSIGSAQQRRLRSQILACAALILGSCSMTGTMTLHNASDTEIVIEESRANGKDVLIPPGATKEVQIDPIFGGSQHAIRSGMNKYCFSAPQVDSSWINHGTVLAVWSEDGSISLYPARADAKTYYLEPRAKQPKGFPLRPEICPVPLHHAD